MIQRPSHWIKAALLNVQNVQLMESICSNNIAMINGHKDVKLADTMYGDVDTASMVTYSCVSKPRMILQFLIF